MSFSFHDEFLIPLEAGQAVDRGWTTATAGKAVAVTWHWTATWDLAACRMLLGGAHAFRKGEASAHYGVGRTFAEGVDRYVTLENRSWHAGKHQTLRWDGKALESDARKGTRTAIGVETVHIGYARDGVDAGDDWIEVASPQGVAMRVAPWSEEQIAMMIAVGKEIVARWPEIGIRDHHGHHDLCPGYKVDVSSAFPFARVLRGIYDDPSIPDVWDPLRTVRQRQRALLALGYDLGPGGADGTWGVPSDATLRRFQHEHALVVDGFWTSFVHWKVHELLEAKGLDLREVTASSRLRR